MCFPTRQFVNTQNCLSSVKSKMNLFLRRRIECMRTATRTVFYSKCRIQSRPSFQIHHVNSYLPREVKTCAASGAQPLSLQIESQSSNVVKVALLGAKHWLSSIASDRSMNDGFSSCSLPTAATSTWLVNGARYFAEVEISTF